jgi:hypothetical protein
MKLQKLGKKYGTDKSRHSFKSSTYLDIYDKHLNDKRENVKVLVEIGILNGASLRMWKEYFPNATIYGVDINPECEKYKEDRIEILIGDQNDDIFLTFLKNKLPNIDVLLDDGSHITKHQIKTFNYLKDNITKGGTYIIEDLANSYEEFVGDIDLRLMWPGMALNKKEDTLKNKREDFNNWIQGIVKQIDLRDSDSKIFSVHHYFMIVILNFV